MIIEMKAKAPYRQAVRRIVDAPGVSDILILLARNGWLPQALESRLRARVRIRQGLVSAALPDGASVSLWHNPSSADITTKVYWDGFAGYENGTPSFFFDRCRKAHRVLDIGANIGYYSILALLANPESEVVAFEPVPQFYDCLKRNIELNQLTLRITALNLAVGDQCGEIPLYLPNNGVLCESSILPAFRPDSTQLRVEATTVDKFLKDRDISSVDLIKIDVEGAEHLVFQGMANTLEKMHPDLICEVLPGRFRPETEEQLTRLGYKFSWIRDGKLVPMRRLQPDAQYRDPNFYFSTHL